MSDAMSCRCAEFGGTCEGQCYTLPPASADRIAAVVIDAWTAALLAALSAGGRDQLRAEVAALIAQMRQEGREDAEMERA